MPDAEISVVTRVLRLREAGHIQRCHTTPHRGDYTVGKHTFDMLILLEALHPSPSLTLFRAVLRHDLHERYLGDVPGFVKHVDPTVWEALERARARIDGALAPPASLDPEEASWLQALDRIELLLWCHDQINTGNRAVGVMMRDVQNGLSAKWATMPAPCRQFLEQFQWGRTDDEL